MKEKIQINIVKKKKERSVTIFLIIRNELDNFGKVVI